MFHAEKNRSNMRKGTCPVPQHSHNTRADIIRSKRDNGWISYLGNLQIRLELEFGFLGLDHVSFDHCRFVSENVKDTY